MKIDLFGGTGFIGNNFKIMFPDVHIHDRDNNEPIYDDVLYMISTTHNYHVFDDIHKDVDTNLTKLLYALKNCNKNTTFNFISSWFVYGDTDLPAMEDSYCRPKGFYSLTKKCAEDILISYCNTFGIKYRILRLCNVYGPNDGDISKKKNALQYLINEVKESHPINLYYDGNFIRDYMHVDDICSSIHLCITKSEPNQIINIGSGIPQNFRDIIEFVIKETNSTSKITAVDATEFHKLVQVKNMYMDVSKLKQLGFEQRISIYDGVKSLL
jgi:nucleoside-diphosphate-sugar epimerase